MATVAEVLITDGLIHRPMSRDMTAAEPASFRSDEDRILGMETEGPGVSEGSHASRTARKGGSEARDDGWLASPVAGVRGESRVLPGVQGEPWAEGLAGWTRQGCALWRAEGGPALPSDLGTRRELCSAHHHGPRRRQARAPPTSRSGCGDPGFAAEPLQGGPVQ